MAIQMEGALSQLPLTTLSELGITELQRFRGKASSEERYCVEIVRRALVDQSDEAWWALEQCFGEPIRVWIRSHPSSDLALLHDSEENYLAQTFSRFWYAVRDHHLEFTTLPAALSYLHVTLNGLITDTLRSHLRLCSREVPLPESGLSESRTSCSLFADEFIEDFFNRLLGFLRKFRTRKSSLGRLLVDYG